LRSFLFQINNEDQKWGEHWVDEHCGRLRQYYSTNIDYETHCDVHESEIKLNYTKYLFFGIYPVSKFAIRKWRRAFLLIASTNPPFDCGCGTIIWIEWNSEMVAENNAILISKDLFLIKIRLSDWITIANQNYNYNCKSELQLQSQIRIYNYNRKSDRILQLNYNFFTNVFIPTIAKQYGKLANRREAIRPSPPKQGDSASKIRSTI